MHWNINTTDTQNLLLPVSASMGTIIKEPSQWFKLCFWSHLLYAAQSYTCTHL